MANPYSLHADSYYMNMRLGTQMTLPNQRETVLHFFDRVQKEFPGLSRFRRSENEFSLEEERKEDGYRWVALERQRLCSGFVGPDSLAEAMKLHRLVLEMAPYMLDINPLELDYIDVLHGFDFSFEGNHDEVIAEALLGDSPLMCLGDAEYRPVDVQPSLTFAFHDDSRLQARLDIATRANTYIEAGERDEDAISVYLIVRRFFGARPSEKLEVILDSIAARSEKLIDKHILPKIIRPLSSLIASRS